MPYVIDLAIIQTLVRDIPSPINLLAMPGAPSAPELFQLGVARVSIGSRAMLATMGLVRKIAQELQDHGTYEVMSQEGYRRAEAQALFAANMRRSR